MDMDTIISEWMRETAHWELPFTERSTLVLKDGRELILEKNMVEGEILGYRVYLKEGNERKLIYGGELTHINTIEDCITATLSYFHSHFLGGIMKDDERIEFWLKSESFREMIKDTYNSKPSFTEILWVLTHPRECARLSMVGLKTMIVWGVKLK